MEKVDIELRTGVKELFLIASSSFTVNDAV